MALPFAVDPQGKLAAEVKADYALGQRIGIEHTPTIWVVTANSKACAVCRSSRPQQALPDHRHRRCADTKGAEPHTAAPSHSEEAAFESPCKPAPRWTALGFNRLQDM